MEISKFIPQIQLTRLKRHPAGMLLVSINVSSAERQPSFFTIIAGNIFYEDLCIYGSTRSLTSAFVMRLQ